MLKDAEEFLLCADAPLLGIDLYCGMGGLSAGFAELGFYMQGVDAEPIAARAYTAAGFGVAVVQDLGKTAVTAHVPLVIGGPPCRPWSPMNLKRRGVNHSDHRFLERFLANVGSLRPNIFVMENVPAIRGDPVYATELDRLRESGYSISVEVLRYDHFGASTKRRRAFTVGVRDLADGAEAFFRALEKQHAEPQTVRSAIARFRDLEEGAFPDHDWPKYKTIKQYHERYATGQYGWRRLEYDSPAPSFGSVAKTYILHPEAGVAGFPERVLSVREVLAITGFSDQVQFPKGTSRTKRYQLVANSVSPQVSLAVAKTVRALLKGF